ncbi:hypothetical protein [Roseiflexus castenholzii]|uniref:hypothetical protein n=1 Tax=Roseiflexus castenholzii TaxID=120962 RepID=UPI0002F3A9C4|nr:hypothetical protein [Roseiflexus castenholzii]
MARRAGAGGAGGAATARQNRARWVDEVDGQRGGQPRGVAAAVDIANGRQADAAEPDARA